MQLSDFDFDLPEDLIALRPSPSRDLSRLLLANPNDNSLRDLQFLDLPKLLKKGDVLVFNNSKTIRAQLNAIRKKRDENSPDVTININLHKFKNQNSWYAFIKPAKRVNIGDILYFQNGLEAYVREKNDGEILLEFNLSGDELIKEIDAQGQMPIPPYIGQKRKVDEKDNSDYQTIFAKDEGSVATPTAGLHFTQAVFNEFEKIGVETCFVTLHVGAGTFLPVKTDEITAHKMHSEYFEISPETAQIINKAKGEGRRIICVGTTSLRTLESSIDENGKIIAQNKETDIFLYPGKKIKSADGLISNFHLPKSTLLMLLSAFCGQEFVMNTYKYAIQEKYRFFSYGDCGLWWKNNVI